MRPARTLWVPIHVHAMMVSMEVVAFALTTTSAAKKVIFVALIPTVLTIQDRTVASAKEVLLEMDDIATTSMSANTEHLDAVRMHVV